MAVTQLVLQSNRWLDKSHLSGSVSAVAIDAAVGETFQLPEGFGQLLVERMFVSIDTLSGAYVAPAPAYDGVAVYLVDSSINTAIDTLYTMRFVNTSTQTTRPALTTCVEFWTPVLVRQREAFQVNAPILAGAGITARVVLRATGRRIMVA